jgi:hypothetical protein
VLYISHATYDASPYDNLSVTLECDGSSTTFDTIDYSQWESDGVLSIEFPYGDESYDVQYNEVTFTGKYSRCEVSVSDYGVGSYVNNTGNYTSLGVEMIPYLAVVEFINCSAVDTAEMNIIADLTSLVEMMQDVWTLLWLVYSIFIMVFAVFMIPIFIFILIRWAIYRITGFRLVERRDDGRSGVR